MTIIWRDKLGLGNPTIDQDHKLLLELFNSVESCLKEEDGVMKLPGLFNQLFQYTKEHFAREEIIQVEINYPKFQSHKLKHQHILESLEKTQTRLSLLISNPKKTKDHQSAVELLHAEIVILAREWVIDHIIVADRELIPYLQLAGNRH